MRYQRFVLVHAGCADDSQGKRARKNAKFVSFFCAVERTQNFARNGNFAKYTLVLDLPNSATARKVDFLREYGKTRAKRAKLALFG